MLSEENKKCSDKDLIIFNCCALSSRFHSVFTTLILDRQESDIRQPPIFLHGKGWTRRAVFCMYRRTHFYMNKLDLCHKCCSDIQKWHLGYDA